LTLKSRVSLMSVLTYSNNITISAQDCSNVIGHAIIDGKIFSSIVHWA